MSSPQTDNTNARISAAAEWLFATPSEMMPRPVIPWVMAEFDLSAREVHNAIMKSDQMRLGSDREPGSAAAGSDDHSIGLDKFLTTQANNGKE